MKSDRTLGDRSRGYCRALSDRVVLARSPGMKRSGEGEKVIVMRR